MKRQFALCLAAIFLICGAGGEEPARTSDRTLRHLEWHVPIREYSSADSVLVRGADWENIQKIRVGMSLDDVAVVCGAIPLEFHLHPNYALLQTRIESEAYEVALKYDADRRIEAISYREMPSGAPEKKDQKTAEPGATDNPDDAQRLREDH